MWAVFLRRVFHNTATNLWKKPHFCPVKNKVFCYTKPLKTYGTVLFKEKIKDWSQLCLLLFCVPEPCGRWMTTFCFWSREPCFSVSFWADKFSSFFSLLAEISWKINSPDSPTAETVSITAANIHIQEKSPKYCSKTPKIRCNVLPSEPNLAI